MAGACIHHVCHTDVCLCENLMACEDAPEQVTSVAASGPQLRRSWGSNSLVRKLRMEQHASLHHQGRGLRCLRSPDNDLMQGRPAQLADKSDRCTKSPGPFTSTTCREHSYIPGKSGCKRRTQNFGSIGRGCRK